MRKSIARGGDSTNVRTDDYQADQIDDLDREQALRPANPVELLIDRRCVGVDRVESIEDDLMLYPLFRAVDAFPIVGEVLGVTPTPADSRCVARILRLMRRAGERWQTETKPNLSSVGGLTVTTIPTVIAANESSLVWLGITSQAAR
ncbi:MAG: hypothetical protein WKF41_12590 [Gaiellaceae bacterium]